MSREDKAFLFALALLVAAPSPESELARFAGNIGALVGVLLGAAHLMRSDKK